MSEPINTLLNKTYPIFRNHEGTAEFKTLLHLWQGMEADSETERSEYWSKALEGGISIFELIQIGLGHKNCDREMAAALFELIHDDEKMVSKFIRVATNKGVLIVDLLTERGVSPHHMTDTEDGNKDLVEWLVLLIAEARLNQVKKLWEKADIESRLKNPLNTSHQIKAGFSQKTLNQALFCMSYAISKILNISSYQNANEEWAENLAESFDDILVKLNTAGAQWDYLVKQEFKKVNGVNTQLPPHSTAENIFGVLEKWDGKQLKGTSGLFFNKILDSFKEQTKKLDWNQILRDENGKLSPALTTLLTGKKAYSKTFLEGFVFPVLKQSNPTEIASISILNPHHSLVNFQSCERVWDYYKNSNPNPITWKQAREIFVLIGQDPQYYFRSIESKPPIITWMGEAFLFGDELKAWNKNAHLIQGVHGTNSEKETLSLILATWGDEPIQERPAVPRL